jgi:hypothetical protein
MTYDVFISFKNSGKNGKPTPDAAAARKVHDALKAKGIKTFFSEESLAEKGQGHFGKSIESALDAARVLVLVASCREHIESKWVETEWDSFLQDVRSGNKEGQLFIFNCGDLKPAELPLFLRRQQMFPESGLDKMLTFIGNAMSPLPTLNDMIELSLHCFRPEKNEDKVYLVTVQQGASASTRNVTAHWGARSSKRLSSQLKAINVTVEAALEEVEKAKQEKHRGGYAPASHVNLLTSEAWSFLTASMGLAEAPAREKKSTQAAKKGPAKAKPVASAPQPSGGKKALVAAKKAPVKTATAPAVIEPAKPSTKGKPAAAKLITTPTKTPTKTPIAKPIATPAAMAKAAAKPVPVEPIKAVIKARAVKAAVTPLATAPVAASSKTKPTKAIEKPAVAVTSKPAAKAKVAVKPVAIEPPQVAGKGRAVKAAKTTATPPAAGPSEPKAKVKPAKVFAPPVLASPVATGANVKSLGAANSNGKPFPPTRAVAPAKPAVKAKAAIAATLKTICISGKLPSGSKKADYAAPLRAAGYELVDDVVKGLSYLVLADPTVVTGKSAKAKSMGVELLSEDQLKAMIQ